MKTPIELYVINRVKAMRIEKGISQAELAFMINVSSGFIGKVETSNLPTKYNLNHINKIAEVLCVSPKELLPNKSL